MAGRLKEHPKVLALAVVSVLVLGAGLGYTYWPGAMPDMPETMEDVPALLASPAYERLTPEQRRPYVQRVSELMRSSDQATRRAVMQDGGQSRDAMRDMFRQMMLDRAKQFALADEAARAQMIAEDRARMQQMGSRPGFGGGDGTRGDRPEPSEQEQQQRREARESRIEDWVNEGNGQEWALVREYMQQVRPRE